MWTHKEPFGRLTTKKKKQLSMFFLLKSWWNDVSLAHVPNLAAEIVRQHRSTLTLWKTIRVLLYFNRSPLTYKQSDIREYKRIFIFKSTSLQNYFERFLKENLVQSLWTLKGTSKIEKAITISRSTNHYKFLTFSFVEVFKA